MEFGPIVRALSRNRMRVLLIVLQIGITLAVIANAVTMINANRAKMQKESGFDDDNLLWVHSKPYAEQFNERSFRITTTQADVRALAGIPGIKAVANTNFLPWAGGGSSTEVKGAGGDGTNYRTQQYVTSPQILDTLGVHIVSGRPLQESDVDTDINSKHSTVVISRALEQLVFKGKSAVGQQFLESGGYSDTVVGVFDKFYNPYGWPIHEYTYFAAGLASFGGARFLVRVEPGKMKEVIPEIEKRLLQVNDGRSIELKTVNEFKTQYFTENRIVIGGMTAVILLLIVVTGLGIVGVTSFSVTERRKQIGTRRALGATKPAILRYFLLENWIITNSGLLIGIALAYALNFLLVTKAGGDKLDWRFVAAGVVLLWLQGLVATLAPATRATAVSPVIATRAV
ncbi:MAG TPA: FtsX-like permease family protein [Thermoanaerobaculia bacterium]|nr:FtsX-like permease family protein [Thermoanaerobaculia bacterium]